MDNQLKLLVSITLIKSIILAIIASYLYKKWDKQDKKYYSDFPFLSAMTFFAQSIVKIIDIFMYTAGINVKNIDFQTQQGWFLLAKFRMVFSPLLTCGFILILLLNIWLSDKNKPKKIIEFSYFVGHILGIIWMTNYKEYLIVLGIFSSPIFLFTVITFTITHIQKKLPMINSRLIAVGYFFLTILMVIRPVWATMGSGVWGLTWVGELVELIVFITIGIGFMTRASFYKKQTRVAIDFETLELVNIDY